MSSPPRLIHAQLLVTMMLVLCRWLPAMAQRSAAGSDGSRLAARTLGKQDFDSRCSGCHGLDGRGGERGPSISANPALRQVPDQELYRIVHDGIPSKGMPAFDYLTAGQIKSIVSYLRSLSGQSPGRSLRGNPLEGRVLFFGKAGCADCHMMEGNGGFLGPDLAEYGGTHTPDELRETLLNPGKFGGPHQKIVEIVTRAGEHVTGVVRNEDNFSLQLLAVDGTLHMLMKSEVEHVNQNGSELLREDYGGRLTRGELEDLVSYITQGQRRTAGQSRPHARGPA